MKLHFDEKMRMEWRQLGVIKDLVPQSRYAAVFSCVDPRYLAELSGFFNRTYSDGFVAVFTEPGGGVPMSTLTGTEMSPFFNAIRLINGLRKLKKLQAQDPIDIWLKFHPDCEWCEASGIELKEALTELQKAQKRIGQQAKGRCLVRCAFHVPKGRTYELNVDAALKHIEAHSREISSVEG